MNIFETVMHQKSKFDRVISEFLKPAQDTHWTVYTNLSIWKYGTRV